MKEKVHLSSDEMHKLQTKGVLDDLRNEASLIENDMNEKAFLSHAKYREHLFAVKNRRSKTENSGANETTTASYDPPDLTEIPEVLEVIPALHDKAREIGRVIGAVDDSLKAAPPIASFIFHAISIVMIPWQCFRERRRPTKEEAGKLSLCVVAASLIIIANAFGVGAIVTIGFAITAAVISLGNGWLTNRIQEKKLNQLQEDALKIKSKMDELTSAINDIETIKTPLNETEKNKLSETIKLLRASTDNYILKGYQIHQLRNDLTNADKIKLKTFNKIAGGAFLVGAILLIPPMTMFGAGIMILTSIVSLTGALRFRMKQRKIDQINEQKITPERAQAIQKGVPPNTPNELRYAEILKEQKTRENTLTVQAYKEKQQELHDIIQNMTPERLKAMQDGAPPKQPIEEKYTLVFRDY
jgi:hypothetical protein